MRKKNKNFDDIIKEELKYSEYLNTRIKEIKKKAKTGREKIIKKKNNFKYLNEFKYLQNEQRRLENELVVQLYNINENEYDTKTSNFKLKSDDILNHFYNITRVEKEINKDFNIIFKLIKDLINKQKENNQNNTKKKIKKENDVNIENIDIQNIQKLIVDLKLTNINLIELSEIDFIELTKPLLYEKENDNNSSDEKNDFISLLFLNDSDNILNINEIDYIIGQELYQSEQTKNLIMKFNHSNYYLYKNLINKILLNFFNPPVINYQIPLQLKEKTLLLLGNEKGNSNIKKIENSFELVNTKYKSDFNSYIKDLKSKLIEINKDGITSNIKLQCNNFIYFIKTMNNNQDSVNKFLKENSSNNNISKYKRYFDFINDLYNYKNNIKILTIKYKEETEKLKNNIIAILTEDINTQKNILVERIDKYNFNTRKKQMELIHQKNVEIFNVKEKIKKKKLNWRKK